MKKTSIIIFICFLAVAAFFFMMKNEKGVPRAAAFKAKPIGEQPPLDSPELHRVLIKSGNSIIFESKNAEETYELDEEELDMFAEQMKSLKNVNGNQNDFQRANEGAINTTFEKAYYDLPE